jgi:putative transposase
MHPTVGRQPSIVKILRAFKTELDLNNKQKTACLQHAGAARFAYNWGLARKTAALERKEKLPSAMSLHRELNALKKSELAWMYDVSKCAPQEALYNLDNAFAQFFRRLKEKRAGKKVKLGFPKYKTKKKGIGSFRLTGAIHVFERSIQLPRLGLLRLKEHGYLPTTGVHILSATVSEKGGHWFVSLQVEMEQPDPIPEVKPVVGVDLGINRMAQVSDGSYFENPRALKRNLTKIKRLHRTVSRRQKGSKNRRKAVRQLSKAYFRVGNIRRNALHQATSSLAKSKSAIVLEDLNVSGMLKNHRLAQAIADVGMYEFKRQLLYKGKWYGSQVLLADRFYPSTKRCSACGVIREIGLKERQYHCPVCGLTMDRDLNAAINLEQLLYGNETTASSAGSNACGEHIRWRLDATVLLEAGTEHLSILDRFA